MYVPFAARQGLRAKEWLSFLAIAVADACPPRLPGTGSDAEVMEAGRGPAAGAAALSALTTLVRAAAAAVDEQAGALSNHPNAGLYASIARLAPGAGHYLEVEPCLVCQADQGKRGRKEAESGAGVPVLDSGSSPSARMAGAMAAAGTAAGVGAANASGSGGGSGGGGGLVFLNYPLDSIKAASKSTENAMLVSFLTPLILHIMQRLGTFSFFFVLEGVTLFISPCLK